MAGGINVTELARQLRVNTRILLETLPQYGFDIGARAIKIDGRVANQIMKEWPRIKRDLEHKRQLEAEEKKRKERELRLESGQTVAVPEKITVRDLAERLSLPVTQLISELMKNGILANQNQFIDYDTASIISGELGFAVIKEDINSTALDVSEFVSAINEAKETDKEKHETRPPVVVVMGHVDHGKTKLLDTIRQTNVVAGESGGITQHIGAYQTIWQDPKTKQERKITFIDTPGHEAFTVMRSRGATVADLAILVVAADDGVKPQTEEVIQIIKAAKLPIVVALNKIDKETADVDRVKAQLSERDIISEDWGGNVPFVPISAKNNLNIDKLLDVLLLLADVGAENITADPNRPAVGTVIESKMDRGMGALSTILVQSGTLKLGDELVINGQIYGKVRAMKNDRGENITSAPPSTPVQIIGFKVAPEVGDILDVAKASTAEKIDIRQKKGEQTGAEKQTIVAAASEDEDAPKKTLNIVVKADVLGSLEAIIGSLSKIKHDEVGVKIIGKGLGNITEDDVKKAEAGGASIVGFHVRPTPQSEEEMRDKKIPFLSYDVIYDLIDWVKLELEKLLDSEKIIIELGILKVLAIFRRDKGAITLGGRVENGKIKPQTLVRVKRGGEEIGHGKIVECQTGKTAAKEVPSGTECGVRFEGKVKIEEGDVLEVYTEESKVRKIVFG